ncbi:MAG: hypothetical protein H7333_05340, partial [Bdellovibrionales bacterium]|nr:hypothetical protein [Oligoflexia bacterium]
MLVLLAQSSAEYSQAFRKANAEIDADAALKFTTNMHALMKLAAHLNSRSEEFSDCRHLVDMGGGSGAWALALTEHHKNIQVSIFDLAPVLQFASKIIACEGSEYSDRINLIAGDFFKGPLPETADSFLLSNILHDWPPALCSDILANISKSLAPGQKLFIHECLLDDNMIDPKFSVFFDLLMALNHHAQQFTQKELDALLLKNGFTKSKLLSTQRKYSLLVAS